MSRDFNISFIDGPFQQFCALFFLLEYPRKLGRGKPLVRPQSVPRKEQLSQASGEPGCKSEWILSSTCLMNHSIQGISFADESSLELAKTLSHLSAERNKKVPDTDLLRQKGQIYVSKQNLFFFPYDVKPSVLGFRS